MEKGMELIEFNKTTPTHYSYIENGPTDETYLTETEKQPFNE
jgi:hypothetical protein